MEGLCQNKFSTCKLVEFEGDHYAQNLFVPDTAMENLKGLIKICYHMMKKKFAQK